MLYSMDANKATTDQSKSGNSISLLIKSHWRGLLCVCISTLFLLFTVLLFLRLALFSIPYYDDYNFALYTKNALEVNNSVFSVIKSFFRCGYEQWLSWQGPYSCSAFSALSGHAFGEQYYFIGPVAIILLLVSAPMLLTYHIVKSVFKGKRLNAISLGVILSGTLINLIHVPNEGLYWFNGGIAYVGMFAFECFFFSTIIQLIYACKTRISLIINSVLSGVLAFIVAGANYVTALQTAIILASILVFLVVIKNKAYLRILFATVIYFIGFILNVTSPGNMNRSGELIGEGIGPINAITQSFVEAVTYARNYYGKAMFLVVLIAAYPILINMFAKSSFKYKKPWLVSIWSFCLYATSFTPGLFALGNPGAGRTINVIKFMFLFLIFFNYIYWLGAIYQIIINKANISLENQTGDDRDYKNTKDMNDTLNKVITYCRKCANCDKWLVSLYKMAFHFILILFLMIAVFSKTENKVVSYPAFGAYYYVASGYAKNLNTEYNMRLDVLKSDEKNIVVNKYHYVTRFLLVDDWSEDPKNEMNQYIARWYDKESIVCK